MSVTNKSKTSQTVAYSESAIRNNFTVVEYCRTSMGALSGCTAGLLGLTGLYGAVFFVFSLFGLWFMLLGKAGFGTWQKFFISRKPLLTNSVYGQLFTYVLFWTFFYGMVHVY